MLKNLAGSCSYICFHGLPKTDSVMYAVADFVEHHTLLVFCSTNARNTDLSQN